MPDHHPRALVVLNRPSAAALPHEANAPAFHLVDPDKPVLSALDQGATRGDGIFETIGVGGGHPQALEHHLRRFERGAAALDLPAPDLDAYRAAIATAVAALPDVPEASAKVVMTRGVEGDGRPSGWVYAEAAKDFSAVREAGVAVVLLDRGMRHDVEQTSPWLLAGAKTLSYAANLAALREAARRGADDVVFVSSDGYLLEGPTSSLLVRSGDTLWTPGTGIGVLDGTTQANAFRYAEALGLETAFRLAEVAQLQSADAAWLVSSIRRAVPIHTVEGRSLPVDREFTAGMNAFLAEVDE